MTGHNCCRSWLVTFCGIPDHNQGPYAFEDIYRKRILSHWGRVTHICVGNLTIIGSDNGLSPGRRQAVTWTNVGMLLIGPIGTNFSEMLIEIHTFSFTKIDLKMSSGKLWPFCLGLNVLNSNHTKSHLPIANFALAQSFWNYYVILMCCVQNFKTIRKLKGMLRTHEISRDLSLRWVSDGYPLTLCLQMFFL